MRVLRKEKFKKLLGKFGKTEMPLFNGIAHWLDILIIVVNSNSFKLV